MNVEITPVDAKGSPVNRNLARVDDKVSILDG